MAKSIINEKQVKAAAARARMAKRSRRQRWIKENKKRILYAVLAFILLLFLAFFTPWGPEYYYTDIQMNKMENPRTVTPGTLGRLYKLGFFYQVTFRDDAALEVYNEIGTLFFGFKLSDYANRPEDSLEKQRVALNNKKKGLSVGPPFVVAEEDVRYVGLAIYRTGEILQKRGSKQFILRLYDDLYFKMFKEDHPDAGDPDAERVMKGFVDRVLKRR